MKRWTFYLSHFFLCISCTQTEDQKLHRFFKESFEANVKRSPTWQTYLGRKTHYNQLDNETEAFQKETHELNQKKLKKLKQFQFNQLSEQAQLSYQLYELRLQNAIESYRWRYHDYPLNQMFGYQSETPSFLINMHSITNAQEARDYIQRLREIKRVFDERLLFIKKQTAKGLYPPEFIFRKVLQDSQNIITGQPFTQDQKLSPLLEDFKRKLEGLHILDAEKKKLILEARKSLLTHVLPAYQELMAYLQSLRTKVKGNFGVWKLPNGDDYYRYRLKRVTTTEMTADEIHQLGLREVSRIHAEMRAIMKKVAFKGQLEDFFKFMRTDKRFVYPDTEAGRSAYLKEARRIIDEMRHQLPKMFKTLPKAKLKVKAVEAFREKSAGIAFYNGPALEGDRPGIYYVNLYKMEDNPKYVMEALAYHEALPGHHMQIAIASELDNLPKFRRIGGYTVYSEGWGLYSELLPKEFGFYQDPYSDFGRLTMELWRACRLVVDTGIHAKRWTRKQAIDYLKSNTPNAELEITKAVERYFILPAQATAYKIGMLKILELREKARVKLGELFDLREFHDVILKSGQLPLNILERQVDRWINQLKTK